MIKRFEYYSSWNTINWFRVHDFMVNLQFLIKKSKKCNSLNLRIWQIVLMRSRANILFSILQVTSFSEGIFFSFNRISTISYNSLRWQLFLYLSNLNLKDLLILLKFVKIFRFSGLSVIKCFVVQNMLMNSLLPEWEFSLKDIYSNNGSSFIDSVSSFYFLLVSQKSTNWVLILQLNINSENLNTIFLLDDFWTFSLYQLSLFFLKIHFFDFLKLDIWQFFDIEVKMFFETFTIFPLIIHILLFRLNKRFFNLFKPFWSLSLIQNFFSYIRYINTFAFVFPSFLICHRICILLNNLLHDCSNLFSIVNIFINNNYESFIFLGYKIKFKFSQIFLFPSFSVISKIKTRLKNIWFRGLNSLPQILIMKINPILRNWIYYFRPFISKTTLIDLDSFLWLRCWRYLKRRHSSKSSFWIYRKYFIKRNLFLGHKRFYGFMNSKKIFLSKFQDFFLFREILLTTLNYSYKFFASFTFSLVSFSINDNSFVKKRSSDICFFFCVLCQMKITFTEIVSLVLYDLQLNNLVSRNKYFIFIIHKKCLSNFILLKVFLNYIQFRFLLVKLSRISF
uniref:Maturase 1-like n=1 Tax=Eutreptia viridis TaxID=96908 RepID=H8ZXE6_9EUGL|nr:maturase 1-like [Eutreptia viridis]